MENKIKISLLGCGWLGFPLALNLISRGFQVKGSTTSQDKLAIFREAGIDPFLIQFSTSGNDPDLHDFLDADILIISVPPGRKSIDGIANYRKMAKTITNQLRISKVSKLIFISSTSVYPDSNSTLNEFSAIDPETESGMVIKETEELHDRIETYWTPRVSNLRNKAVEKNQYINVLYAILFFSNMNTYIFGHFGMTKYTYIFKKAILIIYNVFFGIIKNIIYAVYMLFNNLYTLSLISLGTSIFIYLIKKYNTSIKNI